MTDIAMDPEVMALHAQAHDLVVEETQSALEKTPSSIDAGLGADAVATIVSRVVAHVSAAWSVHGTLGEIVREVARDTTKQEADLAAELGEVEKIVDEIE